MHTSQRGKLAFHFRSEGAFSEVGALGRRVIGCWVQRGHRTEGIHVTGAYQQGLHTMSLAGQMYADALLSLKRNEGPSVFDQLHTPLPYICPPPPSLQVYTMKMYKRLDPPRPRCVTDYLKAPYVRFVRPVFVHLYCFNTFCASF